MRVFTQGRHAGAGGTNWPGHQAEAKKLCSLEQLERSLVGHGETEMLSTVRLEYAPSKPSAISTCIEKEKLGRDSTTPGALQNPLVASPWHNRAFCLACPRPDNIPRLHAPKLLTDLSNCTPPRTASIL